jgi:hypothetical protein
MGAPAKQEIDHRQKSGKPSRLGLRKLLVGSIICP